MAEFTIVTDSACDIAPSTLEKWGVKYTNLTFHFEGEHQEYSNDVMGASEFYAQMRAGKHAKTSAVNIAAFHECFEAELQAGRDVLYLGFSSGLSNTCNAGQMAAQELSETYGERSIIVVDTLAASAGLGLLLYMAVEQQKQGRSLQETAAFIEKTKLQLAHWFTVDDLVYLKRGGRVSAAVALIGSVLNIKPVMHMDNEGHLTKITQVRGRKAALKALAQQYSETALNAGAGTVYISHSDCEADARSLAELLQARHGVEVALITDVGPVIGAHSGPGTIALFFLAKER